MLLRLTRMSIYQFFSWKQWLLQCNFFIQLSISFDLATVFFLCSAVSDCVWSTAPEMTPRSGVVKSPIVDLVMLWILASLLTFFLGLASISSSTALMRMGYRMERAKTSREAPGFLKQLLRCVDCGEGNLRLPGGLVGVTPLQRRECTFCGTHPWWCRSCVSPLIPKQATASTSQDSCMTLRLRQRFWKLT